MRGRRRVRSAIFLTLVASACTAQTPAIRLTVVEGQGALNSVDARRAREPVVRVEGRDGRPVAGAVVNFILPAQGPGAWFADKELSLTAVADENGVAAGRGLRPNRTPGPFDIRVTASAHGETATATVRQINVASAESGTPSRKYLWLALVGGAAVGGAVAAMRGGKTSQAGAAGPPGTTVAPGVPTFGPPR